MSTFYPMFKMQSKLLIIVICLTILSSVMGIVIMKFINEYLLTNAESINFTLIIFTGLILLYLILTTLAQIVISLLGHKIVFNLRTHLLKQILNSRFEWIKRIDKSKIIASLTNDIQHISFAFVRLPELVQGGLFVLLICGYMAYLSMSLFLIIVIWLIATIIGGNWSVKRVYHHLKSVRQQNDDIHAHYESSLEGFKELSLNQHRKHQLYQDFIQANEKVRNHSLFADTYHAFAGNFTNVMMLMAVGIIFYLSVYHQWASFQDATTIALALLFIRGPLITAVGAFPTMMQAHVAFKAIEALKLSPLTDCNTDELNFTNWQKIQFHRVSYQYDNNAFSLKPIDFTLHRGEVIFVIGKNGSGKSTLSYLLSGLYMPTNGYIILDQTIISEKNITSYHQLFSSVFTDFYLFTHLMRGDGEKANTTMINQWLTDLQLNNKVAINGSELNTTQLSQGQRKRLALLVAALEQKSILILDEWAADQDPNFRKVFYENLLPILKNQGYTIFAISHDDKYFEHADRIIEMTDGQLHELSSSPQRRTL